MQKYPLTPEGLSGFQSALYKRADRELEAEAISLAGDICEWLPGHFELTVFQLEFLRSIPRNFTLSLGWAIAPLLLAREPFTIAGGAPILAGGPCRGAALSAALAITFEYDSCTGKVVVHGTGSVRIGNDLRDVQT